MKNLLFLLTLLPAGCGMQPAYVTKHKIEVDFIDDVSVSQADMEAHIDAALEAFSDVFDSEEMSWVLSWGNTDLWLYSEPVECGSGLCEGYLQFDPTGYRVHYLHKDGCVADNALAHELIHLFSLALWNDVDREHANPALWGSGLDSQAAAHIRKKLCQ